MWGYGLRCIFNEFDGLIDSYNQRHCFLLDGGFQRLPERIGRLQAKYHRGLRHWHYAASTRLGASRDILICCAADADVSTHHDATRRSWLSRNSIFFPALVQFTRPATYGLRIN
jgi:hypothetical protein